MKKKLFGLLLIVLSIFLFRYILNLKELTYINDMPKGGDFTFLKEGKSISLSDFRGKNVIIYFGFTFCPDICPTMLSTLKNIKKKLPENKKFQLLFITVDPQRDTQEKIDKYLSFFDKEAIALRADEESTRKVAKMYGVNFSKFYPQKDSESYVIDHTTYALLVDKMGKLVEFIPHAEDPELILETINKY